MAVMSTLETPSSPGPTAGRTTAAATVGDVLELVRSGRARTRSEIGRRTGLSRTAVTARVAPLLGSGLLVEVEEGESTGGRPPLRLRFGRESGVVLAGAIGRSRTQLAVCDLAGEVLADTDLDQEVGVGPDQLMPAVADGFRGLLVEAGRTPADVRGAGLSIPGTVDFEVGASLDSPIMRGWSAVPLAPYLEGLARVPTFVDNDANVMALSERSGHLAEATHVVLLKASTGLGAGVVADGRLVRGALGAAGEIGHVKTPAADGLVCRCGDTGCLEAVAGGWALVQRMREGGAPVGHIRDLVRLAIEGDADARAALRESGRRTGEVLGGVVNLLNPEAVVVGGDMALGYDFFVAGVRETLYRNATALVTRDLRIVPATHGERSGVVGCAALALGHVLSPRAVDEALSPGPVLTAR